MSKFKRALLGLFGSAAVAVSLVGSPIQAQAAPSAGAAATASIESQAVKLPQAAPPKTMAKAATAQKLVAGKVTKGAPVDPGKVSTQSLTSCTTACYKYNTGLQNVTTTVGVSANVMIAWPYTDTCAADPGAHSIAEIAVIQKRASGMRDIVEMGWRSDPCSYGDDQPRLFVFHWVNGVGQGYNAGYTAYTPGPTVSTVQPGSTLGSVTGSAKSMSIQYVTTGGTVGWAFSYDGKWMGAIPADPSAGSTAGNKWYGSGQNFTAATQIQAFGEVYSTYNEPCTDMMNGRWGTISPHSSPYDYYSDASYISNVTPFSVTPNLTLSITPSTEVNYEDQFLTGSVKSFYLGGGGYKHPSGANGGNAGSCS